MNRTDTIRQFYQRLNHTSPSVTEIRAINPHTGEVWVGYFDNEDAFLSACEKLNGEFQLYAGRNPRPQELFERAPNQMRKGIEGGKNTDIQTILHIAVDIDPIRGNGDKSHPRPNRSYSRL